MSDLPEPFVPADADLRDFPFTPIFRARLFGSSFHARSTDAEWRAGVTLWLKSWDQVPAGSLPDDEIDLCRLAELGRDLKAWRKVRVGAMRGWVKCRDGRFYHGVVVEGINEALTKKRKHSKRGAAGAAARWHKHGVTMLEASPDDAISTGNGMAQAPPIVSTSNAQAMLGDGNREGEGHREGREEEPPKAPRKRGTDDRDFDEFWSSYPHKVEKPAALKAYGKARRRASPAEILAGLRRYIADKPLDRSWCNPATFLNNDRWLDQPADPPPGAVNGTPKVASPATNLFLGAALAVAERRERRGDSATRHDPPLALLDSE